MNYREPTDYSSFIPVKPKQECHCRCTQLVVIMKDESRHLAEVLFEITWKAKRFDDSDMLLEAGAPATSLKACLRRSYLG